MLWEFFFVIYLLIAAVCMLRTVMEWRSSGNASLSGLVVGCALCLLWLPALLAFVAFRSVVRPAG